MAYENVLEQRVQKLMYAGIRRNEWDLITMCIAERHHAQVISLVQHGHACQPPARSPLHGNAVGNYQIDDAALQTREDRSIAGRASNLAGCLARLDLNATLAEIPDRFRPDSRGEAAQFFRSAP